MHKISSRQLAYGPLILGCSTRAFRTAAIAVFIKAGSRFETASNRGVSHLLEHLLFRGTQRFSACEIVDWIESQGGTINAFTSEEYTCLHLQIFPANWKRGLDILLDMVSRPLLREEDIERERSIIEDEAKANAENPLSLLGDLFSKSLWGKHPLGNSIEGSVKSLSSLTKDKIRDFQHRVYGPERLAITFAGDLDIDEIAQSIHLHSQSRRESSFWKKSVQKAHIDRGRDLFKRKNLEQVHFQIGLQLQPIDDQERCAHSLLSVLFGESMASRLYQEVREKRGLAYHLHSECSHYTDVSCLSIQAIASKERFCRCIDQVQREIERLNVGLIDERELQRAKSYLLGTTLAELDSPMGLAIWLGEQLFNGWSQIALSPVAYEEMINSIDLAHLQKAAGSLRALWRGTFVGPLVCNWSLNDWKSWVDRQARIFI